MTTGPDYILLTDGLEYIVNPCVSGGSEIFSRVLLLYGCQVETGDAERGLDCVVPG